MIDSDTTKKIKEDIFNVFKKYKDVKGNDFAKVLNMAAQSYYNNREISEKVAEENYKFITDDDLKDVRELWESMIQQFIDFMREHQNILNELSVTKDMIKQDWNDYFKFSMDPDIRFSLYADGLDYSIEDGKWTSGTDSSFAIFAGNQAVIEKM